MLKKYHFPKNIYIFCLHLTDYNRALESDDSTSLRIKINRKVSEIIYHSFCGGRGGEWLEY